MCDTCEIKLMLEKKSTLEQLQILPTLQEEICESTKETFKRAMENVCEATKKAFGDPVYIPNKSKRELIYFIDKHVKNTIKDLIPIEYQHDLIIVKYMVEQGEDIHKKDQFGESILHKQHHAEIVDYLIKQGADVNVRDNFGDTPLHTRIKNKETIKILVKAGADINSKNNFGKTPIWSYYMDVECVETLLSLGADINTRDSLDYTMLHQENDTKVIELLVKNGLDVNSKNKSGYTPLHTIEDEENIETLIRLGGDVYLETKYAKNRPIDKSVVRKVYLKYLLKRIFQKNKLKRFVKLLTSEKGVRYFWNPENLGGKWAKKSLLSLLYRHKDI